MNDENLLDHPIISQRYFFPQQISIPQPFLVDCGDAQLACAYHEVSPQTRTIVHFHGNGEVVADYLDDFPELIGRLGYNCFLAEYRGYGGSTGSPQLGKMLDDVNRIIEAVGQPAEQLVLFGRSVGSLFAIKAAEQFPAVAGLILESAIANLLERLLMRVHPEEIGSTANDLSLAVTKGLDIKAIMSSFRKPSLILHTRHDGLVDVSHAEQLADWCSGPTRLHIFERGSHNDIMFVNNREYFTLIGEFLDTL